LQGPAAGRWKQAAVLAAFIVLAGAESIRLGQDGNWDLKNYHYYNVYAWLTGRLAWDVAPAMMQTYHNPLLDLPFYAMVQANLPPRLISFLMAIPAGIAAYFLLRIAAVLFPRGTENSRLWAGLAVAIGITGAAGHAVIGSTMNEWPPAALLIAAVSVLVSAAARREGPSTRELALAGVLAGIAVGGKLTYGMYALALVIAMMSFGTLRERAGRAFALGCFIVAGFLAAYGFWGVVLYREFASPVFPYFNDLFKSPYWEPNAFFDRHYGPRTWRQWIFFPFYFSWNSWMVGEINFRDFRFPVLFALAIAWGFKRYATWRMAETSAAAADPRDRAWRFVAVFVLASYLAWLKLFGIHRYLVPIEMLTGPLILGAALQLVSGARERRWAVGVLAFLVIVSTFKGSWGRLDYRDRYFEIAAPAIGKNALVILGEYHPMAYVAAFMPAGARFVSPSNNFLQPHQQNLLATRIRDLVAAHRGEIYSLEFSGQDTTAVLGRYSLRLDKGSCKPVASNLDDNLLRLCRVDRAQAPR
jgi:hypothetical protein